MEPELKNCRILLVTSSLFFVPVIAAFYQGKHFEAVVGASIAIASCNFWREPVPGIRKDIDRVVSRASMMYIISTTPNSNNACFRWIIIGGIGTAYAVSSLLSRRSNSSLWVWAHALMHVCVISGMASYVVS